MTSIVTDIWSQITELAECLFFSTYLSVPGSSGKCDVGCCLPDSCLPDVCPPSLHNVDICPLWSLSMSFCSLGVHVSVCDMCMLCVPPSPPQLPVCECHGFMDTGGWIDGQMSAIITHTPTNPHTDMLTERNLRSNIRWATVHWAAVLPLWKTLFFSSFCTVFIVVCYFYA